VNEASRDLRAVDELCRLATTVRRLGCRAHLVGVDAELQELLELAGVTDVLLGCPASDDRPAVRGRVRGVLQ
jgi:anti-anti-sigma regulatory factor